LKVKTDFFLACLLLSIVQNAKQYQGCAMFKSLIKQIVVLAVLASGTAQAAVIVGTVPAFGIDYLRFTSTGGTATFSIFGTDFLGGPLGVGLFDSMITLAVDDGSPIGALTGTIVGVNDDGSIDELDSFLQLDLAAGSYILGIGAFFMEEVEFRSGTTTSPESAGDYQLTFSGVALANGPVNAVPEPTTLALFGLGWLAGVGFGRKRQSA
jgi:hypothetical protein